MTLLGETETQARVGGYVILIVTEKMKVTIPPSPTPGIQSTQPLLAYPQ